MKVPTPAMFPTAEHATHQYSEARFWSKLSRFAAAAGQEVVEKALCLYYAIQNPAMPASARLTAVAALTYFLFPADAIPDLSPLIGYTDDLGALTLALTTIARYVDEEIRCKARATSADWFDALRNK